jgi:hypothetical protein
MTTLSSASAPANQENYLIKAMLVGPSKGGKTTSALTLPGNKLLIDIHSKRSQAAVGFEDTSVISFKPDPKHPAKPWSALEDLVIEMWDAVNDETFDYDSVIIDDLSGMKRLCMDSCLAIMGAGGKTLAKAPGGGPSQAHYGPHIHKTDQLINRIIPLPVHVCFTGHVYTFEDELTNKLESWPNVYGRGLRSEIGSWFDETYYAYEEDGKHFWQTTSTRSFGFLGSTLNHLHKFWKPTDPIEIDFDSPPVGFADLLERRFGE